MTNPAYCTVDVFVFPAPDNILTAGEVILDQASVALVVTLPLLRLLLWAAAGHKNHSLHASRPFDAPT